MLFHFLCRISSRSRENHPNPEEPEEEDENVQAERARTANALTTLNPDEVTSVLTLHKTLSSVAYPGELNSWFFFSQLGFVSVTLHVYVIFKSHLLQYVSYHDSSSFLFFGFLWVFTGHVFMRHCNSTHSPIFLSTLTKVRVFCKTCSLFCLISNCDVSNGNQQVNLHLVHFNKK